MQSDRLDYAMDRLRRARQPYCANNGVLTVLPHAVIDNVVYRPRSAPRPSAPT